MKWNKKISIPLTVLVLLVCFLLFVAAVWNYKESEISEISFPEQLHLSGEIEGWDSYKNGEYGFKLNYPSRWMVRRKEEDIFIESKENVNLVASGPPYGAVFHIKGEKENGFDIDYDTCPSPTNHENIDGILFKCFRPHQWRERMAGLLFDCCSKRFRINGYAKFSARKKDKEKLLTQMLSEVSFTDSSIYPDWITQDKSKWSKETNKEKNFEFRYPSKIGDYIGKNSWPPEIKVKEKSSSFECKEKESFVSKLGNTTRKKISIDDKDYCATVGEDGAMGAVYKNYRYKTNKDNKQITVEFTLKFISCGALGKEKFKDCVKEQENFEAITLVDEIISTFKVLD